MSTAVLISLEEFQARPEREDGQREELIEGELIVSPGPKVLHAHMAEQLRTALQPLKSQGFVVANDFSCILGARSMPAPDLAAVRLERWSAAMKADNWLDGAPELVIEVSSPSNRALARKAALYLQHGAEQVWVVSPKRRTITVHTAEDTAEARMGETVEYRGVTVRVVDVFPE